MKRVVITGLGVISPVGQDVETFWSSLRSGQCGIGPITRFEAGDEYKVKLAAEVKDFDPTVYMEKSEIRKWMQKRRERFSPEEKAKADEALFCRLKELEKDYQK